jgi:peptide/nickel transport system substrate-binding protein
MARTDRITHLVDDLTERRIDRRTFFQRATALGLSVPAAGALFAACGGGGGSSSGGSGGTGGASVSTKLLRVHLDEDMENLDPAVEPGHSDTEVGENIFEGLVTFKPGTWETVNQLAETWEPSSDGLTYRFKLKPGIQFHKGYGEVTADDVKFSFERIAGLTTPKLESPYAGDWAALKEVQVTGKYEGVVKLKEPFAPLMTTTVPGQSGQIVSKKAVEKFGDKFGTNPVGTGPYEFVSWTPKQQVVLKKFTGYGGASKDFAAAPQWGELRFVVIGEDNPTTIALETGELDFALLPTDSIDRVDSSGQFDITKRTSLNYNWIGMNVTHPNLKDKNVRLAIRYGIDVPSIIEAAFDGKYTQATGILPPGMPVGYWKDAPKYQRDVDKAKGYLKQAGAEGRHIVMSVSSDEAGAKTVAEIVQQNLNEIGLNVSISVQDGAQFDQATKAADADKQLFYSGFTTNPDPSWSTVWFTCDQVGVWNYMSWCNETYSSLDKKAARTVDPDQRQQMYEEMQKVMDEDVPAIWVAWPTAYYATKKGIKPSLRPDGRFVAWNVRTA